MPSKKCSCGCGSGSGGKRDYVLPENGAMTLAELPIGSTAVIDRILPMEQAAEAHQILSQQKNIGKVVLTLP